MIEEDAVAAGDVGGFGDALVDEEFAVGVEPRAKNGIDRKDLSHFWISSIPAISSPSNDRWISLHN